MKNIKWNEVPLWPFQIPFWTWFVLCSFSFMSTFVTWKRLNVLINRLTHRYYYWFCSFLLPRFNFPLGYHLYTIHMAIMAMKKKNQTHTQCSSFNVYPIRYEFLFFHFTCCCVIVFSSFFLPSIHSWQWHEIDQIISVKRSNLNNNLI